MEPNSSKKREVFKTPLKTPIPKKTALSTGKIQKTRSLKASKDAIVHTSLHTSNINLSNTNVLGKSSASKYDKTLNLNLIGTPDVEKSLSSGKTITTRRMSKQLSNNSLASEKSSKSVVLINQTAEQSPVTPVYSPKIQLLPGSIKKSAAKAKRSTRHNESLKDHLESDTPVLSKSLLENSMKSASGTPIQNASHVGVKKKLQESLLFLTPENSQDDGEIHTDEEVVIETPNKSLSAKSVMSASKFVDVRLSKTSTPKLVSPGKSSPLKRGVKRQLEISNYSAGDKKRTRYCEYILFIYFKSFTFHTAEKMRYYFFYNNAIIRSLCFWFNQWICHSLRVTTQFRL